MSFFLVVWIAGVLLGDLAWRRVTNRWMVTGAILAIGALVSGISPLAVTWHDALTGGGIAFVALLGFYLLGMMGAGDVKFAAVLGLWLGGPPLVPIAIGAGLLAGGHALVCLARRHGPAWLGHHRRHAADATPAGTPSATTTATPTAAPALDGAIPYAGYLALMALLWIALRLGLAPH